MDLFSFIAEFQESRVVSVSEYLTIINKTISHYHLKLFCISCVSYYESFSRGGWIGDISIYNGSIFEETKISHSIQLLQSYLPYHNPDSFAI